MKKFCLGLFIFGFLCLLPSQRAAEAITYSNTYTFDWSNELGSGAFGTVGLDITDTYTRFTLSAAAGYSDVKWKRFYFNYRGPSLSQGDVTVSPGGTWKLQTTPSGGTSTLGTFDFGEKGTSVGFNDPLVIQINKDGLELTDVYNQNADQWFYAAHMSYGDNSSHWLGVGAAPAPPIPEPGTLVLLGAGLIGLAALKNRIRGWT